MPCPNPELHGFSACLPYALPQDDPAGALRYLAFDAMQLHRALNMDRAELEALVAAEDLQTMLTLLVGTVLYRHIDRFEQMQVRELAEGLASRRLVGEFQGLHAQIVANPGWNPFSLSDVELEAIMAMNGTMANTVGYGLGAASGLSIVQDALSGSIGASGLLSLFTLSLLLVWQMENGMLGGEQQRRNESYREQLLRTRN